MAYVSNHNAKTNTRTPSKQTHARTRAANARYDVRLGRLASEPYKFTDAQKDAAKQRRRVKANRRMQDEGV